MRRGVGSVFSIDKARLESESRLPDAKSLPVNANGTVFDNVKLAFVNLVETIAGLHVYDAAHWACNIDRWQKNLASDNRTTYKRGTIVFLDLGSQNFKFEPSYTHACVVLADRRSSILVVPCSTKKYNSHYSDIINATPEDGFSRHTGIQSESFRWVSKNRVVSSTGKQVSARILDQLDAVLVSFAPSNKKRIRAMEEEIKTLRADKEALELRNRELESALKRMESECVASI